MGSKISMPIPPLDKKAELQAELLSYKQPWWLQPLGMLLSPILIVIAGTLSLVKKVVR